ncbi:type IV secretory system conjugative DNA transfer family protein [Hydrogenivirga sp.]
MKESEYREKGAYIYLENRNSHLLVFGRTRWGKTRFIERAVVDDIEVGNSVFVIDPKGDYDLLEAIIDAVERTGRREDFMFFSVVNPEVSVKVNPFADMPPDRIGDMLKALAPTGKEGEFFSSVAFKLGKAVASGLYAIGRKRIRIIDILEHLNLDRIQDLYDKVDQQGKGQEREDALLSLKDLVSKDPNYWSKISTTAEVLLDQLSTGTIGELFGRVRFNPIRERVLVERKPIIFYAFLGRLVIGEEIASAVARLLSTTMIGIYGHMYANNDYFDRMFVEYIDEAKQVFHRGIEQKFNIAGGLNVSICAFTQSKGDLEEKLGKDLAKVIMDNTNWLLFSVLDPDTAEQFSRASGVKRVYEPIWEEGDGKLPKLSLVPKDRPLIERSEFMRLRKGCFHGFLDGSWYRGYSDLLKDRRSIWIKPLPYPVKELIKKGKMEREDAIKLRSGGEEEISKYVDAVVDLTEYPYYETYILKEQKDTTKSQPSRVEEKREEVAIQEIPSESPASQEEKEEVSEGGQEEVGENRIEIDTASISNPVDKRVIEKIASEYEKIKDTEINKVVRGGGIRILKKGDKLYISSHLARFFDLTRKDILQHKKLLLAKFTYKMEKNGREWEQKGSTRCFVVRHQGLLDFIPDYPYQISVEDIR